MTNISDLIDDDGFLKDYQLWSIEMAEFFAQQENILLTCAHWQVINFLREH